MECTETKGVFHKKFMFLFGVAKDGHCGRHRDNRGLSFVFFILFFFFVYIGKPFFYWRKGGLGEIIKNWKLSSLLEIIIII